MVEPVLSLAETLEGLPPEAESAIDSIRASLASSNICTVVLDDDPTGTQTVADISVLTDWERSSLVDELNRPSPLFYVLTNSRALPETEAVELAKQLGTRLAAASAQTGRPIQVVSRSDSTLRGHFPAEVDAVGDAMVQGDSSNPSDAVRVLCPFFLEGGRYTIDDVHYAADGDRLVPCAATPFARDAAFGYRHSNLVQWALEKCGDGLARGDIHCLSLESLRSQSIEVIADRLMQMPRRSVVVVNAAAMSDVETFVAAAMRARSRGQSFLYRSAASLVRAMAGQTARPLLGRSTCRSDDRAAGLIVVGSYVPKTTQQWNRLVESEPDLVSRIIDLDDALSLDADARAQATAQEISDWIRAGKNVAIGTSRELRPTAPGEDSLDVGRRISHHLVNIVRSMDVAPGWLIAKGGITSSDLATEALGCRRAEVLGQIAPGIPVWRMGAESRRPGLAYVVFPGNVGTTDTLRDVYRTLK